MRQKIPTMSRHIKKIIMALRNKPLKHKEFTKLEIPQRTVSYILKQYLEYWGLVKKEEGRLGRWYWREKIKEYKSKSQYELFMNHTKDLVPTLETLLKEDYYETLWMFPSEVSGGDLAMYVTSSEHQISHKISFVEEHLRTGYPEFYDQLIELRRLKEAQEKEEDAFKSEVYREIIAFLEKLEPDKSKWSYSSINDVIDDVLNHSREDISLGELTEPDFTWFLKDKECEECEREENILEVKSKGYYEHAENFRKFREEEDKLHSEFAGNIAFLLMKSLREPLEGTCKLCPRVIIRDDKESRNGERGRTSKTR